MPSSATPTLYIETTIPNFFFDLKNQSTEKKIATVFFWENNLKSFKPVTSLATIRELENIPDTQAQKILLGFLQEITQIEINNQVISLAEQYVEDGLIPQKYSADAIHLALTIVHKIDYLLTWNIQHLAHPFKRKQFKDYNMAHGLYVTEIVTPQDLNYQINP